MNIEDAFSILGLDLAAFSTEMGSSSLGYKRDVINAYLMLAAKHRKLLLAQYHPDKNGDPVAFKKVNEAYDFIKKESERIIEILTYKINAASKNKVKIEIS